MVGLWETKKALIVVRTYPVPAVRGAEVSCTAAITEEGKWLRLFPIPYRFLSPDRRFRKYQWVSVEITKAKRDTRPESYTLNVDSIRILEQISPAQNWKARKQLVFPLRATSLCELKRRRERDKYPTLGIFRPKVIKRLVIERESDTWTKEERAKLEQPRIFGDRPKTPLEKIPYKFSYEFCCEDSVCPWHTLTCIDWEMAQSWRSWKSRYGKDWESKFRQRYETDMIEKNDTHFYVGNMAAHQGTWIIVGLFYPPREKTPAVEPLSLPLS